VVMGDDLHWAGGLGDRLRHRQSQHCGVAVNERPKRG